MNMPEMISRRSLLTMLPCMKIMTAQRDREGSPQCVSEDMLPSLRCRFGMRVHPDVLSVKIEHRAGLAFLVMEIGPNAAWSGAFHDFEGMHSCTTLLVLNDLARWGYSVDRSARDNSARFLESEESDLIGRIFGLLDRESDRKYPSA